MQTLINSLLNGTNEYRDGGLVSVHPPTATALRAARELTTLVNTNTTNDILIQQLQFRVNEQLNEILTLQSKLNELQSTIQKIQSSNVRPDNLEHPNEDARPDVHVQHVRESEGQTSTMASKGEQLGGSDSDSEGRGTN